MRTFRLCILPLGFLLANCIPIPHEQREAPELHGVVLDNGLPVANTTVRLIVNPATSLIGCPQEAKSTQIDSKGKPKETKSTQTDANGQFKFARTTYHQSVYPFASHRMDTWRVCFDRPDGTQAVWQSGGAWGGPPRQDLRCVIKPLNDAHAQNCTATNHDD